MSPAQQALAVAPPAVVKSQYHHFIPRLILRGFTQDDQVSSMPNVPARASKKQWKKRNRPGKDGLLHFIDIKDGRVDQDFLSSRYGLKDMYRNLADVDQHRLEKKLAILETAVGNLIARARKTFAQPGATLVLDRQEKDILRKFLFIMKYRNSSFHSRFSVASIDDYVEDDKEKMRQYMQARQLRSPIDVWFSNIHAFLDIELDPERKWQAKIQKQAYPDDARMFILHVDQSYIAFCRPQSADDEFLLTDNVFSIFEGPNSLGMNPTTGELERGIYTEWHNFAPLSSSLLLVLRSNYLPGTIVGADMRHYEAAYQSLLAMHTVPERAGSALQDLPVERCTTSYFSIQGGKATIRPDYQGPGASDLYTFKCFELGTGHVNLINGFLLEEAMTADSITFKSSAACARAIRAYLEDQTPGMKVSHVPDSDRDQYLAALVSALPILGDAASPIVNKSTMVTFATIPFPLDYGTHMARLAAFATAKVVTEHPQQAEYYQRLPGRGKNQSRKALLSLTGPLWLSDVEQAGKVLFLHIKIDSALNDLGASLEERRRCKSVRTAFFATLPPQTIWLYLKALRNLKSFDNDDFTRQVRPLECEGPEDRVVGGEDKPALDTP